MKKSAVFLIFLIFVFACQFTPDDKNFVELTKPPSPDLQVIELGLDQDTILLTDYQNVRFNFSAGNNKILEVAVLIDGEKKYVKSNYHDSFNLIASDISEGIHKLTFSVVTNSNSGSIADLLGQEGYQFLSNEWTLICVINDRQSSFVTQEVVDGKLRICWENYNKIGFKSYRVTKSYRSIDSPVKEYHTTEPFFTDESYVGEGAFYQIYAEYYSGYGYEYHWAETTVKKTLPEIGIRINEDSVYEVFWGNNQFVSSVGSYKLLDVADPSDTITLCRLSPGIENHFNLTNAVFGNKSKLSLVVIPKYPDNPNPDIYDYFRATTYDGYVGDRSFGYGQISSVNKNELMFIQNNNIYKYNPFTNTITDSLTYEWAHCGVGYQNFSVSPDGKYFTSRESCIHKLVLMKTSDLSDYHSYTVNVVLGNSMEVSDNGIVILNGDSKVNVYDVFRNKLISSYPLNADVYSVGISSWGNYFYVQTSSLDFYKISGDTLSHVWGSAPLTYNYIYKTVAYDPENAENILLYDGAVFYHKNASDFTTTKSFPLNEEMILNIDLQTRRLLAWSEDYLSVYEIDNGKRVARIKADLRVTLVQHKCKLCLNTIYLKNGVCVRLPE